MLDIVILAAGKGTRMRSSKPKVLHTLAGKPFVSHVIDRSHEMKADAIKVVIGHGAEQVEQQLAAPGIEFVEQTEQLGTGHAVQQVLPLLHAQATILILYGDVPLIKTKTLEELVAKVSDSSMGLLTIELEDPMGYGRIVRENGEVVAIVEQKDATDEQLNIAEINTGVMAVKGQHLLEWLPALSNDNAQGEYYLTDIIAMARNSGISVQTTQPESEGEVMGVNNRMQQAELERIYQREIAEQLMVEGVTLLDPARFDCRGSLTVGSDCVVDVNCVFEGKVTLGNNVHIGPNCMLKDTTVGDNTQIHANSVLEDSELEASCNIGPYARLRPGSKLAEGAKIGNFVETKKAVIGKGSKVNHLSYVGDAELGEGVNVGAGTITCNYDGVNKHKTSIGDGVFVGSNTALVAPVSMAKGTTIAAGSIVTRNSKENELVVARSRQQNLPGWKRPTKKS
ncbi:bifunctional UDP-N-acetylglucosamine diphosphorylase/glucosamine-1-phosphate N-acetyltransferase GlmU [Teredinibacter haidensis]|uniref:bifunctional UDP-N-acetylglucosamine diphosphorylase/glucosamine-1-phosphate N-acetyltransferase GlmU n=1 Tax=Teredinibacter haidensis TaxID=2731755 RepID=UPI000948E236|nr:bifunctional UDP-N-acetylglucosamine diphosphorylase/glucosamine-1-phosphate N-acetyltransferase GlmU [Teredinibacter haidensis]